MSLKNKFVLGTAQFSGKYGILKKYVHRTEIKKILNYVKKKKLFFLDTSIEYKNSDKKIGLIKSKKWRVITKIKFNKKYYQNKDVSSLKKIVIKKLNSTKKNIGINNFETLLVHNFEELDYNLKKKIYKTLISIKNSKLIKKFGFSIYNFDKLEKTMKYFLPNVIQCPYNIFDRRFEKKSLLRLIKKNKIEIHARSNFLQGLLLISYKSLPSRIIKWKDHFKTWDKWIEKNKISKLDASLNFVLLNKNIKKIVIGVNSKKELDKILKMKKTKVIFPNFKIKNKGLLNPSKW